jgi:hypothetical protein
MTEDDAYEIARECHEVTCNWPLETISVESVIDAAQERWSDFPRLREYAEQASARVWSKWSSTGDVSGAAVDWALDLMNEYAEEDGIKLQEIVE